MEQAYFRATPKDINQLHVIKNRMTLKKKHDKITKEYTFSRVIIWKFNQKEWRTFMQNIN